MTLSNFSTGTRHDKRRTCLHRVLVITLYLPSFHSSLAEAESHPFVIACCSWPGCATPSWERFSRNCKALRRTLTESAPVPRVQACPKPASREYLYSLENWNEINFEKDCDFKRYQSLRPNRPLLQCSLLVSSIRLALSCLIDK